MCKMMSIPNSEPYGSTEACNKHSKFLLKGVLQTKSQMLNLSPEGRIRNVMY